MTTCLVDPVADLRWSELIERAPDASVFHHPLWLALIRDTYRYAINAVCVAGADGELVAGLPIASIRSRLTGNRLVSVPFSDICDPVLERAEAETQLVTAIDAERRRLGLPLEVHGELPSLPDSCPSERFYHHLAWLDDGIEAVLRRVKQSKRTGAARARRNGLTAARCTDLPALEAFFSMHVLTRRKLGSPTQPWRFFRGLAELLDREMGFVLLIESDGDPVAAGVFLRHGSTLTYKYGASDPSQLGKRPNDLMMLEALRLGCELGCSTLDMGRTELDNPGLRSFKREFGAEERELSYTIAPAPSEHKSVRSISSLHKKLIQHSPPLVSRLVGAAVYRHFG